MTETRERQPPNLQQLLRQTILKMVDRLVLPLRSQVRKQLEEVSRQISEKVETFGAGDELPRIVDIEGLIQTRTIVLKNCTIKNIKREGVGDSTKNVEKTYFQQLKGYLLKVKGLYLRLVFFWKVMLVKKI